MEFNGTFFVTIITFIVFVFLMNKILYAPILNIMEERKNFVDGNYKTALENTMERLFL
jgi:F0F1-type ATP synthase membrane subunit b/b'